MPKGIYQQKLNRLNNEKNKGAFLQSPGNKAARNRPKKS